MSTTLAVIILVYFITSLAFLLINTPLNMSILLLIKALLATQMMLLINSTSWFSYILFLVFLGGMMVLFIYITTLAPNEMTSMKISHLLILATMSSLIMLKVKPSPLILTQSLNMFTSTQLINLYTILPMKLTLILMGFLLMTLIIVIKISNITKGPLRSS
nr:NADH dehydrogenase subunit 6 [Myrmecophilus kubotai]